MSKLRFIILSLCLTLLVSACGGSADPLQYLQQSFQTFSVDVPATWQKVPQENFANTVPEETVGLFLNKVAGDDFIQNVNIVKESLNTDATSLEYAKANMLLGSKAIVDYRPISSLETDVNGLKTVYHLFRARNASTDPLRYYAQTYFANNRLGYTVTCIAKDEDQIQQQTCETVVKSFRFQTQ
jgi:hypothetical protein